MLSFLVFFPTKQFWSFAGQQTAARFVRNKPKLAPCGLACVIHVSVNPRDTKLRVFSAKVSAKSVSFSLQPLHSVGSSF